MNDGFWNGGVCFLGLSMGGVWDGMGWYLFLDGLWDARFAISGLRMLGMLMCIFVFGTVIAYNVIEPNPNGIWNFLDLSSCWQTKTERLEDERPSRFPVKKQG